MRNMKKYHWAYCLMFIVFGVLLSLFENVLPGTIIVLLVLQFPVFIAGFLLGSLPGLVTGAGVPLMACILTGFPSAMPMLPMMMAELMLYGYFSGLLSEHTKMPRQLILIIVMIIGRMGYLTVSLLLPLIGQSVPEGIDAINATIDGIPGIFLELVLIPPITDVLEKFSNKGKLRYE